MRIELFYTTGYQKCAHARAELKSAAEEIPGAVWRELDALDHPDYAIELGVTTLPAIVIDRKMIFSSLPTPRQLRDALKKRVKKSV